MPNVNTGNFNEIRNHSSLNSAYLLLDSMLDRCANMNYHKSLKYHLQLLVYMIKKYVVISWQVKGQNF